MGYILKTQNNVVDRVVIKLLQFSAFIRQVEDNLFIGFGCVVKIMHNIPECIIRCNAGASDVMRDFYDNKKNTLEG